jgi:hypothetical protein
MSADSLTSLASHLAIWVACVDDHRTLHLEMLPTTVRVGY